jgi:SAM-dependent methyltransferase
MEIESGNYWRAKLEAWAIPKEILDQAPENPWIHPPAMFQIPDVITDSISHQRAREAIQVNGSVLDIGCGGGIAAFALTPPATTVIGVDHQPEMLEMFEENAKLRRVSVATFDGFWPEVERSTPVADVVVAHHVLYNVAKVEDFLVAMNSHATKRVVIEMPQQHPLTTATPLWQHFWNLDRPTDPKPEDLIRVLAELGIDANLELWEGEMRQEANLEMQAHYSRIRLCLQPEREGEVLEFLKNQPKVALRKLATIWWDK